MKTCAMYQDLISQLVDNEITDVEKSELDVHIRNCSSCRAYLNIVRSMSGLELSEPPAELTADIMKNVRSAHSAPAAAVIKRKRLRITAGWIAAAACFAVIIFSVPSLLHMGSSDLSDKSSALMSNADINGSYDQPSAGSTLAPADDGAYEYDQDTVRSMPESEPKAKNDMNGDSSYESSDFIDESENVLSGSGYSLAPEEPESVTDPAAQPDTYAFLDGEPLDIENYRAVVKISSDELIDSVDEYERTSNIDGTYSIVVPDTYYDELSDIGETLLENTYSNNGEILIIYAPGSLE